MNNTPARLLMLGGWLCLLLALFQAAVSLSPQWSYYFGAGEMALSHRWRLLIVGEIVALIFMGFGLYALSGAGHIRRLPLLRPILTAISALFILRGLLIFPQLAWALREWNTHWLVPLSSSVMALVFGSVLAIGTLGRWKALARPADGK